MWRSLQKAAGKKKIKTKVQTKHAFRADFPKKLLCKKLFNK